MAAATVVAGGGGDVSSSGGSGVGVESSVVGGLAGPQVGWREAIGPAHMIHDGTHDLIFTFSNARCNPCYDG